MDLKKLISSIIPRPIQDWRVRQSVRRGLRSYSQHGEDLILDSLFVRMGIQQPDYLDIGAYHPYHLSNTALFYRKGCRGTVVDANPEFVDEFKKWRPGDQLLLSGVGPSPGQMRFFIFENSTLNTFSEEEKVRIVSHGLSRLVSEIDLQIMTLNQLVDRHLGSNFPHLLSLDVEGMDKEILLSTSFDQSFPLLICVETNGLSGSEEPSAFRNIMEGKGYKQIADTGINSIFQHYSTLP